MGTCYIMLTFSRAYRLKSASYDLMKQTGDWQCGGRTHRDHSDAFDSLFLREADNLSQEIHTKTGMDETSARVLLCQLFQVLSHNCCSTQTHTHTHTPSPPLPVSLRKCTTDVVAECWIICGPLYPLLAQLVRGET